MDLGAYAYKIPDDTGGTHFSLKRPFDISAGIGGYFVAIEVKRTLGERGISLKSFRPHQPVELDRVLACGGLAYVFIVAWAPRKVHHLRILDWKEWGERIKSGESISVRELRELPFIVNKCGVYDLSGFIDEIKAVKL